MDGPKRFRILHISDLHCSNKKRDKENSLTVEAIATSLVKKMPIHFVVFTGDLFVGGGNSETIEMVYNFLFQLKKILEIEESKRFFFVPGNQDVVSIEGYSGKKYKRFEFYIKVINKFMQGDTAINDQYIHWFTDQFGFADNLRTAVLLPSPVKGIDVEFLLMNSVWDYIYDRKPPDKSKLEEKPPANISIREDELDYFKDKVDISNRPATLRIALMHNSLLDLNKYTKDAIKNAGALRDMLDQSHVSLLLHGDRHKSIQGAAAKGLNSWPLYVLGVGQVDSETGGADAPHFQILEITQWDSLYTVEIEVASYKIDNGRAEHEGAQSYHLCSPIENIFQSVGSIHKFELAQPFREEHQSHVGKELLFKARAKSFDLISTVSEQLFQTKEAKFKPDQMYLLFYQNMFNFRGNGGVFRAVHDRDWKAWLKDPSVRGVIENHKIAASKQEVDIRRVIILQKKDTLRIRNQLSSKIEDEGNDLLALCELLSKHTVDETGKNGRFITQLAKAENISYYDDVKGLQIGTENMIFRNISPANIALFSEAPSIKDANESNSVVFYFDHETDGIFNARINISKIFVNRIKAFLGLLFSEDEKFVDCRSLKTLNDVKTFVNIT